MQFIEAPTTFYLGRRLDADNHKLDEEIVYYDSRDLTTHAVIVGMTGSGKTGLGISLIEEAVMDNIPAIVIDPKGDITNLLLTFPQMRPEDFAPWVNIDDARRAGMEPVEYAGKVAQQWRDGLADWGIVPGRIGAMKRAAQFSIYTPGSDSGLPLSILNSLQAPREGWAGYEEMHRENISGIAVALLALIGIDVEPIRDREHVLIANIFENAWKQGQNLTLEDIILQVQNPPFAKLGVFDVDTFFPKKDRFKLAMALNKIIAAPSFQSWLQGEPIDVRSLLYTADGRPRVSVIYVAHLNDAERTFIITLILENMLSWMRTLSGTTSLRALLYFDEMFGFFPPAPHNPATKEPLLRLLKQARAFGIGLILATQNPGDLDYKGLSNAGTWFIGKLQTEHDKSRVLDGLQGAATAQNPLNTQVMDKLLSRIDPRVFVLHNVHNAQGPILLSTRWTMSYLRGPLTRQQVRLLMESQRLALGLGTQPVVVPTAPSATTPPSNAPFTPPTPLFSAPSTPAPVSLFGNAAPSIPTSGGIANTPPAPPISSPPPAPGNLPEASQPGAGLSASPAQRRFGERVAASSVGPVRSSDFAPSAVADQPPPANPAPVVAPSTPAAQPAALRNPALPDGFDDKPAALPTSVAQYYLPTTLNTQQAVREWERKSGVAAAATGSAQLAYRPVLLAQVIVRYLDRKSSVAENQMLTFEVPDLESAGIVHWNEYSVPTVDRTSLTTDPPQGVWFGALSPGLADARRITALRTDIVDYLYRTAAMTVLHNTDLDFYGKPNESQRDFMIRLQAAAREARDAEVDKTTTTFDKDLQKLEEKLKGKMREHTMHQQSADELRREDVYTTGEAMLRMLRGRPSYTLSRMSRVRRYKSQVEERARAGEQHIADIEHDIETKQGELRKALQTVNDKWAKIAASSEEIKLTPFKKDIALQLFGVGWTPLWYVTVNGNKVLLPATAST